GNSRTVTVLIQVHPPDISGVTITGGKENLTIGKPRRGNEEGTCHGPPQSGSFDSLEQVSRAEVVTGERGHPPVQIRFCRLVALGATQEQESVPPRRPKWVGRSLNIRFKRDGRRSRANGGNGDAGRARVQGCAGFADPTGNGPAIG